MLAELYGKLDPLRNDSVDRSEDLLTDAVFGSVRHLPRREVLGPILAAVGAKVSDGALESAEVRLWQSFPVTRWTASYIEPDVVIIAGRSIVVFEAKLHSAFCLYHDPGADGAPYHQLAVQYAAVRSWAAGERLDPPTVVAVTASTAPPLHDLARAAADIERIHEDTLGASAVGWLSWRTISEIIDNASGLRTHERQHVDDLLAFMEKRGVRRMFNGFKPEDYWLVSAAQRVAADRLYRDIASFIEDLGAALQQDGIGWGQDWRSVWANSGTALNRPLDWTRSFIGAHFWPTSWPVRRRLGNYLALYAAFDFIEPALDIGLSIPGPGAAAAQAAWTPHLDEVAKQFTALSEEFTVAFDVGDVARPTREIAAKDVDMGWLGTTVAGAVNTSHLRLRTRIDPLRLTVQLAREKMTAAREAVEACPGLWKMLVASGHLKSASPNAIAPLIPSDSDQSAQ